VREVVATGRRVSYGSQAQSDRAGRTLELEGGYRGAAGTPRSADAALCFQKGPIHVLLVSKTSSV
ncbi:UNVERIFIED_CONTAM: hypothetical protein K2H54_007989, partial [Gekko kuhli]